MLGQDIRLLMLSPGEPTDKLQCEIIHVSLENKPAYETVSYAWATDHGNVNLSHSIYCNHGVYVSIMVDRDSALRQRRNRAFMRRPLWIVAICI
jgi:hypothetical protein